MADQKNTIHKGTSPKLYIETYGCQMNTADSEVVVSVLQDKGYEVTEDIHDADIILVNTCSIRENAEQRVWGRLDVFKQVKKKNPAVKVGVIGCMAERLKEKLIEEEIGQIKNQEFFMKNNGKIFNDFMRNYERIKGGARDIYI